MSALHSMPSETSVTRYTGILKSGSFYLGSLMTIKIKMEKKILSHMIV